MQQTQSQSLGRKLLGAQAKRSHGLAMAYSTMLQVVLQVGLLVRHKRSVTTPQRRPANREFQSHERGFPKPQALAARGFAFPKPTFEDCRLSLPRPYLA